MCQPFDADGPYDKRYTDVIEPAVADAGLEPYRVDRDPSASIPIDKLEETIRTAAACVAFFAPATGERRHLQRLSGRESKRSSANSRVQEPQRAAWGGGHATRGPARG